MDDKEKTSSAPMSIEKIGVHLEYQRETMQEIKTTLKELVEKTPSRTEFEDLKKEVARNSVDLDTLRGDRRIVKTLGYIIIALQVVIGLFIKLYVGSVVDDKISSYDILNVK